MCFLVKLVLALLILAAWYQSASGSSIRTLKNEHHESTAPLTMAINTSKQTADYGNFEHMLFESDINKIFVAEQNKEAGLEDAQPFNKPTEDVEPEGEAVEGEASKDSDESSPVSKSGSENIHEKYERSEALSFVPHKELSEEPYDTQEAIIKRKSKRNTHVYSTIQSPSITTMTNNPVFGRLIPEFLNFKCKCTMQMTDYKVPFMVERLFVNQVPNESPCEKMCAIGALKIFNLSADVRCQVENSYNFIEPIRYVCHMVSVSAGALGITLGELCYVFMFALAFTLLISGIHGMCQTMAMDRTRRRRNVGS